MLAFLRDTGGVQRNNKEFMPSRRAQLSWKKLQYRHKQRKVRESDSGTQA